MRILAPPKAILLVVLLCFATSAYAQDRSANCRLWTDSQGVPHVKADSELGGISCWGYLHGRDRAWQMDYFRRTAQGRKAEVFGASAIRGDFVMRAVGLAERATRVYEQLPSAEKSRFEAYTYGVNRGLQEARKNGIYELKFFGGDIEPWRPSDSVALILLQSFDQTRKSFEIELAEETQARVFGLTEATQLFNRDDLPWDTAILKRGEYQEAPTKIAPALQFLETSAAHLAPRGKEKDEYVQAGPGEGSNSWVIAPSKSASGKAWLANDPHLGLKYPPFWHWSHVQGGDLDVMGASLPGVPLVTSGSNRKVAWGLTNAYLPVAKIAYVPLTDIKNERTTRPVIWVKVWKLPFLLPMFFKTYIRTEQDWPLLPLAEVPGKATVLRWSGFDVQPTDFAGLFKLMHSTAVADADTALATVGIPTWNFVYADTAGGIGYRAIGRTPREYAKANPKDNSAAFGIPNEPLEKLEKWIYLSKDEMPHLLKPARGYIVTANNRQWPKSAQLQGGHAYSAGFRAFRIEEMITSLPKQDLGSLRKIQCDVQSVDLRFLLPELIKVLNSPLNSAAILAELKTPLQTDANQGSRTLPLYRRWVDLILEASGYDETALFHQLRLGPGKLRNLIAGTYLRAKEQTDGKTWGELHRGSFSHLAGDEYFLAKSTGTAGDTHSVNPGTMVWKGDHYEHTSGASQRLIVEMTDPPTIYQTLAGPNLDEDHRNLSDPAFMNWANCAQERRVFPLDWTNVQATELKF